MRIQRAPSEGELSSVGTEAVTSCTSPQDRPPHWLTETQPGGKAWAEGTSPPKVPPSCGCLGCPCLPKVMVRWLKGEVKNGRFQPPPITSEVCKPLMEGVMNISRLVKPVIDFTLLWVTLHLSVLHPRRWSVPGCLEVGLTEARWVQQLVCRQRQALDFPNGNRMTHILLLLLFIFNLQWPWNVQLPKTPQELIRAHECRI